MRPLAGEALLAPGRRGVGGPKRLQQSPKAEFLRLHLLGTRLSAHRGGRLNTKLRFASEAAVTAAVTARPASLWAPAWEMLFKNLATAF